MFKSPEYIMRINSRYYATMQEGVRDKTVIQIKLLSKLTYHKFLGWFL